MKKYLLFLALGLLSACQTTVNQSRPLTPTQQSTQAIHPTPTRLSASDAPAPTSIPTAVPSIADASLILEDTVDSQSGTAYALAFSPDGSTLAIATGVDLTVVDATFKRPGAVVRPPNVGFLGITWNPGGDQLASVAGLRNPNVYIWNWDSAQGKVEHEIQMDGGADLYAVSWSPDGTTLVALSEEPTPKIHVWDTASWEKTHEIDLPARLPRRALDWSPDSKSVYEAGEDAGELVLWRIDINPPALTEVMQMSADVTYLSVSPDASKVATTNNAGQIRILSVPDGQELAVIQAVAEPVDIDWHPQGTQMAVLSYRTALQIWDLGP